MVSESAIHRSWSKLMPDHSDKTVLNHAALFGLLQDLDLIQTHMDGSKQIVSTKRFSYGNIPNFYSTTASLTKSLSRHDILLWICAWSIPCHVIGTKIPCWQSLRCARTCLVDRRNPVRETLIRNIPLQN
jgi:hypothetical protein